MSPRVLFSVGDASGDRHAAALARALRERDPDVELFGLGGRAMAGAGVDCEVDASALAIGGFVEVVRAAGALHRTRRAMLDLAKARRPDLVVLVDSGGFNLPFARAVRRVCDAPILYFVAPQLWAWRRGRIRKLARRVDRVAVIWPFEVALYEDAGVPVDFVGHPLIDEMSARLGEGRAPGACERARARLGLDLAKPVIAFMPGSRRNEVEANGALYVETMRRISALRPGAQCVLVRAPSIPRPQLDALVAGLTMRGVDLHVVDGDSLEAIEAADVVLTKPGTTTTEAMLLRTPMVVAARAHPLTAFVARRLVRVSSLAMPNILAGEPVVPELLQGQATPDVLAGRLAELLGEQARKRQLDALEATASALGPPGAIERTADVVGRMLGAREGAQG